MDIDDPLIYPSPEDFVRAEREMRFSQWPDSLKEAPTQSGQALQRSVKTDVVQPKLKISQHDDIDEQEADELADQMMRMPDPTIQPRLPNITPLIQRQEPEEEEEEPLQTVQRQAEKEEEKEEPLQVKSLSSNKEKIIPQFESTINRLKGSGQPLDPAARAYFESRFGCDFSEVRVHTDARATELARAVNAKAFTVGKEIVFEEGQYVPETYSGRQLLTHELTHVVQQNRNGVPSVQRNGVSFELDQSSLQSLPTALKNLSEDEMRVLAWLQKFKSDIAGAEKKYCVDRRAIAGAIAWEALENVKSFSLRSAGPGKIHYKTGFWERGTTTLEQTEKAGYLPPQTEEGRRELVADPIGAINSIAAIMKADADAISGYMNIYKYPGMLATFYNAWKLDEVKDLARQKMASRKPNELPLLIPNEMGIWVENHHLFLEDAVGKPELPSSECVSGPPLETSITIQRFPDEPGLPAHPDKEKAFQEQWAARREANLFKNPSGNLRPAEAGFSKSGQAARWIQRQAEAGSSGQSLSWQQRAQSRVFSDEELGIIQTLDELTPGEKKDLKAEESRILAKLKYIVQKIGPAKKFTNPKIYPLKDEVAIFEFSHPENESHATDWVVEHVRFLRNGLVCHDVQISKKKKNKKKEIILTPFRKEQTYYDASGAPVQSLSVGQERIGPESAERWQVEQRFRREESEKEIKGRVAARLFTADFEKIKQIGTSEELKIYLAGVLDLTGKRFERQGELAFVLRDEKKRPVEELQFQNDGLLRRTTTLFQTKGKQQKVSYYDRQGLVKAGKLSELESVERSRFEKGELEKIKATGGLAADVFKLVGEDKVLYGQYSSDTFRGAAAALILPFFQDVFRTAEIALSEETGDLEIKGIRLSFTGNRGTNYEKYFEGVKKEFEDYFLLEYKNNYKVIRVKKLNEKKREMGEATQVTQEMNKRINEEALVEVRQKTADDVARATAGPLCHVIAYFLYGKLTKKTVGETDTDKELVVELSDFLRKGIQSGYIGLETQTRGGTWKELVIEFPYWGIDVRGEIGQTEWKLKEIDNKGKPLTPGQISKFLRTNANLAISHQDIDGKGYAHHFMLIVKDNEGIWRNMDHTDSRFFHRGGETDFSRVYRINYDETAVRELAQGVVKSLEGSAAGLKADIAKLLNQIMRHLSMK
jgi:hypothetical protein